MKDGVSITGLEKNFRKGNWTVQLELSIKQASTGLMIKREAQARNLGVVSKKMELTR